MRNRKFYLGLCLALTLVTAIYYSTFVWLSERFLEPDSYYSHGFLVPLITAFLIWQKRKRLNTVSFEPSASGLMLLVSGLILQIAGVVLEVYLVSLFSLLMIIFGITFYLFGRKAGKEVSLPLVFLIFMVPIPMFIINHISFPMRQLVTGSAVFTLDKLGLPVTRKGFEIIFPNAILSVDTPCGGLRSLITFLALGFLFAYFLNRARKNKIVLFLMAIPIAFASNYLRIILLSLVAFIYGANTATDGLVHDFSGIMVFVVGFMLLAIARNILSERI